MIKIVVDTLGGDLSPKVNIEGCVKALQDINDLEIVLTGDQKILENALANHQYDHQRLTIVHAPDVITCDEAPVDALRKRKDSSLVKAYDILKNDDQVCGLVSIGSTGVVLAGSVLKIGRIKGVNRPAFCPILPTMNHGIVGICDSGANVDCSPLNLLQFAIMGSLYMEKAYNIEKPRIALLNIGTEEIKGDILRKETYQLLKNCQSINFVGNMEGRDLLSGKYDLVVCDGFSGNVLIKSTEGACLEMLKLLKQTFTKSFKNKMGAMFLKKDIMSIKNFMDYNNYGGGVMLGVNKIVVKGHGSSKSVAVYNCIKQVYNMEKANLCSLISNEIANQIEVSVAQTE